MRSCRRLAAAQGSTAIPTTSEGEATMSQAVSSTDDDRVCRRARARSCAALLLAAAGLLAAPQCVLSQAPAWPGKPIRLVVSWPAGGGADVVARIVAEQMSRSLGQPILVDNRPGAGGTIGTNAVVRADPDGYTLLFAAPSELSVASATFKALPYDPVKDLQPITQVMRGPYLLVAHPSFPPSSMAELVAYAKANPGKASFSSFGNNTLNHLYGELLKSTAGFDALHVPYKGSAPALADLLGGQINFTFDNVGVLLPLVKAGRLKALAVTAPQRLPVVPGVPTMAEAGFASFDSGTWLGMLAPARIARPVVSRLHAETVAVLASSEVRKAFDDRSVQAVGSTPEEFGRLIARDAAQWQALAAKIGLQKE